MKNHVCSAPTMTSFSLADRCLYIHGNTRPVSQALLKIPWMKREQTAPAAAKPIERRANATSAPPSVARNESLKNSCGSIAPSKIPMTKPTAEPARPIAFPLRILFSGAGSLHTFHTMGDTYCRHQTKHGDRKRIVHLYSVLTDSNLCRSRKALRVDSAASNRPGHSRASVLRVNLHSTSWINSTHSNYQSS